MDRVSVCRRAVQLGSFSSVSLTTPLFDL